MRTNTFISTLLKAGLLVFLFTAAKLGLAQPCDPSWNRSVSSNCENSPIQFNAGSPGRTDFNWDFGDGTGTGWSTFSGQFRDPLHSYTKAGLYIVTFNAKGGAGPCSDTVMVLIKESPTVKVKAITPLSQCFLGNKFCFIDSTIAAQNPKPASKILSIKYLFSDGALYTINDPKGGDTICHTVIDPNGGFFDLVIEAEDLNGCITKIVYSKLIRVFPKLGVSFTSDKPDSCVKATVTIRNTTDTFTKLSEIAFFKWDFGDPLSFGNIITGDSVTNTQWWRGPSGNGIIKHRYDLTGRKSGRYPFNGKLTVTTKYGCTETYVFNATATISVLTPQIVSIPDSSCSSEPEVKFSLKDGPIGGARFLWIFGDPPSGPLNFEDKDWNPSHSYGLGPWMISIRVRVGPCDVTVFDTITKIGPTSTIEVPFNRVPEDEKYQCVIRDTVHFPNNSKFYHTDDHPVYEDSSGVYRYYTLLSFSKVGYWELPLKEDTIRQYGTYQGKAGKTTVFYLEKDTLESFNQSVNAPDSIIFYINGKKVKKLVTNPIISGKDTLVIIKRKEYAFRWPGNQTAIPSLFPPATQRHKEHVVRLWSFGDNFAPKCTTDTKKRKNVGLNCNWSMDSLPKHWYTPWEQLYKYYNNGQYYATAAEKTVLCKGGRFCYKVRYYPRQSFVIPADTLVIVPKNATYTYGGMTITPGTPEKMTGSFRIKKIPPFLAGLSTYVPTLSDEIWTFRTPGSVQIKSILTGAYSSKGAGTFTLKRGEQFELKAEYVWRTYTLSSTRNVVYDELKYLHSEPLHKYVLIFDRRDSILSKGTYNRDLTKVTRFYLEKDTLETFNQKYNDPDSIYYFVSGVRVKKPIVNPIKSGNDILDITEFRTIADTAFSQAQVWITAGRTITAQPTTICVDTVIAGRDTFIQRSQIFIDSNFHRQNFYLKNAQCNTVSLYHEDTIHSLRCKSTGQVSLALVPPSAKGLEFKGIKCYAPPSPPYGMEFTVSKTKPGCTQRLLKFNFDSAGGKNNWVSHGGFLSPPLPGSAPWHLGYQLSGAYPTAFVKPYGAGDLVNKNPGWVTVGVIIGNGRWLDKAAPVDSIECIDTVWYHNAFRYLYLDSRFNVIAPEKDQKTVCVGDTITFQLVDPIMDSVTSLVWNWNDDEGSYYEERTFYYQPYKGPNANRNDKNITGWKKTDKWLYHYVIRLEYNGFSYKTLDTIVTGIIRKWVIAANVQNAGEALKTAFAALGLNMNEIPADEIPLYFGNGTGTGCIDTTGLGDLITFGVAPYRDALTFSRHKPQDVFAWKKNGKDSLFKEDWYRYTDFTKKDSTIISQTLHRRAFTQAGWDTLKQANPNRYSNLKVTPGVYRHVYTKANRYFPTFQLRNTEGCFQPRNREVDVGFYWNWTYSDTVICHGTDIIIKDSIRYFAYEDPFIWLDPFAYWKNPTRFGRQQELKKIDFNEHDDSLVTNKFAVRGLGIPPFRWRYDDPGIYTIRIAMKDSFTTLRDPSQWIKNGSRGCVDTARQKVYVTGVLAGFKALTPSISCKNIVSFLDTTKVIDPCVPVKGIKCDSIVDWTWDFGDGKQRSKLKNPSHDYTQNGYFTVRLKVRTLLGCEDSASVVIFIAGPRPYFNPISDTIICVGDSVIFQNLSKGPFYQPDWEWNFGDGKVLSSSDTTLPSVGHRYTKAGKYDVYLKQFDNILGTATRCFAIYPDSDSDLVSIVKRTIEVKNVAPAAFDILPNDTICPNTEVTFLEQADPLYERFIWKIGIGDTTLSRNKGDATKFTYTKVGQYKVILIPDYDLLPGDFKKCADTIDKIITVIDVKADFDIDSSNAPDYCFKNTSVGANKYEWIFEEAPSNGSSTETDPCYKWQDTGCHYITLVATNYIGCTDTMVKQICSTFVAVFIPYNVFTPEPVDGFNDVFRVKAEGLVKFDIVIYNRWGEVVFKSTDPNFRWNGTVKNKGAKCPEGTYFYIINYQIKEEKLNDGASKPISGTVSLIRGEKD